MVLMTKTDNKCCNCKQCRKIPREIFEARVKLIQAQDERIEREIERMIITDDVVEAIYEVISFRWAYLGNYLAEKGVFG